MGGAVGGRTRRRRRRYRLVYRADSMVNWCPGLGTVLANEEVTVRRPQRPRKLPGVPEAVAAVDDADHRLLRPAARRPRGAGLAGEGQGHAAQLDRPIHRRRGAVSRRTQATSRSSPPVRTRCSARPTWCWRPSIRWSTSSPPRHGPTGSTRGGPSAPPTPAEAVADYRRVDRGEVGPGAPGEQVQDRRVPRQLTPPIRSTAKPSRSSSPTTCWPGTAPGPSWRCPAVTSATGTSPRNSACRSSKSLPAATSRRRRTTATARW